MHYLYILFSKSSSRYYIGESINPTQRVLLHNQHHFKNAFTNIANDWELKLVFKCNSKKDALKLERFIKKMKSKIFIQKIIEDKSILLDVLSKI